MAYIKFYRGASTNYDTTTHANCVYFCTDTKELKLDGNSYGISDANLSLLLASAKSVSVAGNVLTFTFNNGSTADLTLPTATSSSAGVMSAADKTKLDKIAEGANKTTVDSALSSTSTNPVQNKVINSALAGKANSSHTHSIADVNNLQKTLDGKSDSGHTHNYAGSSSAGGAANSVKSNITIKLNSGTTEDTNLYTYNGSTTKTINITPSSIGAATSGHNHDGVYAKNAFSKVTVGSTTIEADSTTDTLTLTAGSNISITPDATNDKITIASTIPNAGSSVGGVKSGGDVTIANGIITVNDDSHNHVIGNIDNLQTTLDAKAPLASPALTGTPTAPTAGASTNNTQIATTAFVNTVVNNKIAASDAMIYKGTLGANGTITELPNTTAKTGWTYKVITAGTYASQKCEVGDMIICLTDGSTSTEATWTVVQNNIDGAVTGPTSSVADRVVTFNGTSGKVIKDSGYTIAASVPSGAKFTDTTYAAGTGLSLSSNTFSLSGSGVTAGSYGPTANVTGTNGVTLSVPQITVDSYGRVTSVASRTYTSKDTTYGIATNSTSGLVKPWYNHTAASTGPTAGSNATAVAVNAISTTAGRYYALETDNAGRGFVNVPWTNTTYSANNGISLSGTTFSNSGVRSIASGSTNGTISVNTNGTSKEVAVKGLGTAAYTASTSYAKASHTHTGAQVTMSGYSTISGGSITASDTVNTAINKLEDMLIWHEA